MIKVCLSLCILGLSFSSFGVGCDKNDARYITERYIEKPIPFAHIGSGVTLPSLGFDVSLWIPTHVWINSVSFIDDSEHEPVTLNEDYTWLDRVFERESRERKKSLKSDAQEVNSSTSSESSEAVEEKVSLFESLKFSGIVDKHKAWLEFSKHYDATLATLIEPLD